jgi:hypothetical protein
MAVLGPRLGDVLGSRLHMAQGALAADPRSGGAETAHPLVGIQHARTIERLLHAVEVAAVRGGQQIGVEELKVIAAGVVVAAEAPGVLGNDDAAPAQHRAHPA